MENDIVIQQPTKKRKAISKKLRFEVFKRDSFKCQYCGKPAPDVVLHIDHINPVKHGGKNDILNLITSCIDCNLGKGSVALSDQSALEKQRQQLQEINERREQLRMLTQWRDELIKIEIEQIKYIDKRINDLTGSSLSDVGRNYIGKAIKKFGFNMVLDATDKSYNGYVKYEKGKIDVSSVAQFIDYIPRVCACMKAEQENPDMKELAYISGILRNRFSYCTKHKIWTAIMAAYNYGISTNEIKKLAKACKNWGQFQNTIESWID